MLKRMKEYHQKTRLQLTDGIRIYHCLPGAEEPQPVKGFELSFWDDVQFVVNNYRVTIYWTHPRYAYCNLAEDKVHEILPHPEGDGGLFSRAKAIYRSLGRSRKKVRFYEMGETSQEVKDYYDKYWELREQTLRNSELFAIPNMKVKYYRYCKGVDLCIPVEVRNNAELKEMASLAKALFLRQTTLDKEFPGYKYGAEDYCRENPEGTNHPAFISHAIL